MSLLAWITLAILVLFVVEVAGGIVAAILRRSAELLVLWPKQKPASHSHH
jgi:hypothetical protein